MGTDCKLPFNRALLWILVSTLLVSGSAFMGWLYFLQVRERRFNDDQYRIVAIIQRRLQGDSLRTVYLAELLNLSLDRPVNLYQFNTDEGVRILLSHPVIKQAEIKKILPGTLYIQYKMRTPCAYVGDYSNTFVDEEGFLFPCRPFYTPKKIPILYLGLQENEYQWGGCLKEKSFFQLATSFIKEFSVLDSENLFIKQLDVMQAQADSYGKRQIVLMLEQGFEEKMEPRTHSPLCLRLSTESYFQDMRNFRTLYQSLLEKEDERLTKTDELMIDLRIPHLAFIKTR